MKSISCMIIDDELTAREILMMHLAKLDYINVIGHYRNPLEALTKFEKEPCGLIFLDINMPEISGIKLKQILGDRAKVIFTTAYREFAPEAFDLDAVDYLLKPITFDRLEKAISKYQKSIVSGFGGAHIFVRSDRKMVRVELNEILFIESFSDYLKIYLENKMIITRERISRIAEDLPKDEFIRIHRSYIVALSRVQSFKNDELEIGGRRLTISRGYKEEVLNKLNQAH